MTEYQTSNAGTRTAAIVVAAGKGLRAAGEGECYGTPKQYREICGRPLLALTLDAFIRRKDIGRIVVVIGPQDHDRFHALGIADSRISIADGGDNRQESVLAGLEALALDETGPDFVLIHDAARPFVGGRLMERILGALKEHGSALPLLPIAETVKKLSDDGTLETTLDRERLRAAQTPQAFAFAAILDAHRKATAAKQVAFTDDASIAEWAGMSVHVIEGESRNFKITTPDDFDRAANLLSGGGRMETRTAQGFDVHRFMPGDHVVLGGVGIPHDMALSGHSDADVLLHAITDAIYGAITDGDIGAHFPPSDPQWKGADSSIFLEDAVRRVRDLGGQIVLIDATLLCEAPKIGPHRDAIRARIADIAAVPVARVAVKATTTEQLGFPGRREGIAAMALATIRLPSEI